MDLQQIKELLDYSANNLTDFTESERELYAKLDFKVNHFFKKKGLNIILLIGLRGVGKTTILKTIAKKYNGLYTSGDFLKLKNIDLHNLSEVASNFDKQIIIIDEILYLSDWQLKLKVDAGTNQNKLYIISGSSALQLKKISQDLSRRLDTYKLYPLSFKEFLRIKHGLIVNFTLTLNDFIKPDYKALFLKLINFKSTLPKNIFKLYREYLNTQFPFILEETNKLDKVFELAEKVIYKDIPLIDTFYSDQLKNIDLIIKFISTSEKINYTSIATNLGLKKDMVIKILDLLEKAELIYFVPDIVPTRELRTNKKILFSSPSIRNSLNQINIEKVIGFSREDSFGLVLKLLNRKFGYNYNQNGFDFLVDGQKFEIGNNKKNIKEDVIVISDSLDISYNGFLKIPFYLFSLIEK